MAQFPPLYIDCVVAIGAMNGQEKRWIGTGFFYGDLIKETPDKKNLYNTFLVTNKHVLNGHNNVMIRFNSQVTNASKDYDLVLIDNSGNRQWIGHPSDDVDVAILPINIGEAINEGMKGSFFQSDRFVSTISNMISTGSSEGDFVYVLGFPMGILSADRQHVFVRGGVISRITDLYEGKSKDFVIDAFVFPGNSGGPVISKPEMMQISGTSSPKTSNLIGLVKSYLPYNDVAISQQTGKPRVIFEDNTGLTLVEPVDRIIETINFFKQHSINMLQ